MGSADVAAAAWRTPSPAVAARVLSAATSSFSSRRSLVGFCEDADVVSVVALRRLARLPDMRPFRGIPERKASEPHGLRKMEVETQTTKHSIQTV